MSASVPSTDDPAGILQLREALWAADFTANGVAATLKTPGGSFNPRRTQMPALRHRLTETTPLATLIRLFVLAVPVAIDQAAAGLAPLTVDRAAALGLVTIDGDQVHALVRMAPAGDLVIAHDLVLDLADDLTADTVVGVSSSTRSLADLTVRRPVDEALDLGTGCGIQALLAARRSTRVTATDTNPRLSRFAAFNARLNGVDNIDFLQGDLLDAVGDRTFDLIVSNPPFVISPDDEFQYRDGGRPRDLLSREVVEGVAGLLRDGGFAHVLVSWVHEAGGDWSTPLRDWVTGRGCDAWLLHFKSDDAASYATDWNMTLQTQPDRHAHAVERWLDYFDVEGIDAIGYGAVSLRRRDGDNWVRTHSLADLPLGPANDQVRALFTAQDFLTRLGGDEALLDQRFVVDDHNRLDQSLRWGEGKFEVDTAMLRLARGMPFRAVVDVYSAHLLARFDGRRTVREAMEESAELVGSEHDRSGVESRTVAIVKQMVELGFVHPSPGGG